jgi:hypothetical protein
VRGVREKFCLWCGVQLLNLNDDFESCIEGNFPVN